MRKPQLWIMLERRELSKVFAPFQKAEGNERIKRSIATHGYVEAVGGPIVTLDGKILDGWSRYRACVELGIEPPLREWAGELGTPVDFLMAMNLDRDQCSVEERATVLAKVAAVAEVSRASA